MNKTLALGFITIAIAAGVIGMTHAPQTTKAQDEGDCYTIPSGY